MVILRLINCFQLHSILCLCLVDYQMLEIRAREVRALKQKFHIPHTLTNVTKYGGSTAEIRKKISPSE